MCNCNQQRLQYTEQSAERQQGMVKVQLAAGPPFSVNGNITGRLYVFRNLHDTSWVDKRDAHFLAGKKELRIMY